MHYPLNRPSFFLTHQLQPLFGQLAAFGSHRQLWQSALYSAHRQQLQAMLEGIEWENRTDAPAKDKIRVVAWNIERGKKLPGILHALQNHAQLKDADILLLCEADIGCGRSYNRNVPRELARALGLNYCFANAYLALGKGDITEQNHERPNDLGLHGTAVLSRFAIQACDLVPFPCGEDPLTQKEKRLGCRKGQICRIPIGGRPLDFAALHLEFETSPAQRRRQLQAVLDRLATSDAEVQLIGGDWNTTTLDLSSRFSLARDLCYKLLIQGLDATLAAGTAPHAKAERPLFTALEQHGFALDPYNQLAAGTFAYDLADPSADAKTRQRLPTFLYRWIHRRLAPYDGRLNFHLDWFAGKGLRPVSASPQVVKDLSHNGAPVSDHDPIVVELRLDG